MKNLKRFNENQDDWSQPVNGSPNKNQKIIGIPNGSSYHSKMEELNELLNLGWKIINVSKMDGNSQYSGGLLYVIEK